MKEMKDTNPDYQVNDIGEIIRTKDMKRYEDETGKYAVWRGVVTEGYKKWKEGEKVYDRDKERISLYISEDAKKIWQEFIQNHNYTTISKLIRDSVKYFIEKKTSISDSELLDLDEQTISSISHALKEPLTTIKGFSQLLLENYKDELNDDVLNTIKNIFDQSTLLESRIVECLERIKGEGIKYDVLLIEDDIPTIRLITSFFEGKNLICKGAVSGKKGLEELIINVPMLILLDIILPDISGYEICKRIKSDEKFKSIPLYYLTAIPGTEVEKNIEETGADGYILKPFDLSDFEPILNKLQLLHKK